jgi:hypothetical protein
VIVVIVAVAEPVEVAAAVVEPAGAAVSAGLVALAAVDSARFAGVC